MPPQSQQIRPEDGEFTKPTPMQPNARITPIKLIQPDLTD